MRDRYALPLLALVALAMSALALVWPQGEGAPSPPPFDRPMAQMNKTSGTDPTPSGALRGPQGPVAQLQAPP